jgi:hypothetical protein
LQLPLQSPVQLPVQEVLQPSLQVVKHASEQPSHFLLGNVRAAAEASPNVASAGRIAIPDLMRLRRPSVVFMPMFLSPKQASQDRFRPQHHAPS